MGGAIGNSLANNTGVEGVDIAGNDKARAATEAGTAAVRDGEALLDGGPPEDCAE